MLYVGPCVNTGSHLEILKVNTVGFPEIDMHIDYSCTLTGSWQPPSYYASFGCLIFIFGLCILYFLRGKMNIAQISRLLVRFRDLWNHQTSAAKYV